MRTGRRVAFDIGKSRVGIAVSDPHGILASPREFVARLSDIETTVLAMVAAVREDHPIEYYVGLPTNLRNESTESTDDAIKVARALHEKSDIDVRMIDERLTTRIASSAMSVIGKNTRQQRGSIDSAAATVILETALQYEKANGTAPGIAIGDLEIGS